MTDAPHARAGAPAEPSATARFVETILIALFFALATGILEASLILIRLHVVGSFAWVSRHHIWMSPLGYAIYFLVVGTLIGVLRALAPRRLPMHRVVLVFAALSAFSVLLPIGRVGRLSGLVLAVGVGVAAARIVAGRAARVRQWLPRATLALATLVLAAAVGVGTRNLAASRLATRDHGSPPAGAPSILLIILDTVRASSMALYGYDEPNTPNLDRRAAEGVLFERAYATAPWTLPSHASMFSGRHAHVLSADWAVPVNDTVPMIAEALQAAGYRTAGFVANIDYASWDSGLARGFAHYDDYRLSLQEVLSTTAWGQTELFKDITLAGSRGEVLAAIRRMDLRADRKQAYHLKYAPLIVDAFLDWLDRQQERPFFAFLNLYDAHFPFHCPPPFDKRFGCESIHDESTYHGAIALLDAELERMFRGMQDRDRLANTLVIVTSDHGELFGEHGLSGHGNAMYMPLLHVPMLVFGPGVPPGRRVADVASIRDIAATIAGAAGLDPRSAGIDGASLARFWTDAPGDTSALAAAYARWAPRNPPYWPISKGDMFSLFDRRFHYILNGDGTEDLFDYLADPAERRDLAGEPSVDPTLIAMREALRRLTTPP